MQKLNIKSVDFDKTASIIVLLVSSLLLFLIFSDFLSINYPTEDLPAHIEISRRLVNALKSGYLFFYDRFWFSGWPAFQFYGFLPHLVAGICSIVVSYNLEQVIRFISILACSLLPFSFYFSITRANQKSNRLLIALLSASFSLWFLKLDEPFFGVGFGAILGVGLFPQAFGWHFILLSLGCIFSRSKCLSLIIAMSFIGHTLSGVVVILFCLIWFLLNPEDRKYIAFSVLLGFGLISFWVYPFLKFNANFTSADVYRVPRDCLSLLFRYPLTEISIQRILNGEIELFRLIFIFATLVLLWFGSRFENKKIKNLTLIILLLTIFTSSDYIASSNFLALHYYRIDGLLILPVLVLFASILAQFMASNKAANSILVIALLAAIYNSSSYSPDTLKKVRSSQANSEQPNSEMTEVINYLKESKSRIFVEFNNDYNRVPLYSGHLIESSLLDKEIANGLFVESSNTSRFLSFSAEILGGSSFHGYLLFIRDTDIDPASALKQLQSFSIQTVVASSEKFAKSLENLIGPPVFTKGIYKIFNISGAALIEEVNKPLVGYVDLSNQLPFTIISQYFYSRNKLFNTFQLINITPSSILPTQLEHLMINGEKDQILKFLSKNKTNAKILPFYERAELTFSSTRTTYPVDKKVEIFKRVKSFFDKKINLENRLTVKTVEPTDNQQLSLNWETNRLKLNNLRANKLYLINYSFSPLFKSNSMDVYRAGQERIIVAPQADGEHELNFSVFNIPYYGLSILMSIISLILITLNFRTTK